MKKRNIALALVGAAGAAVAVKILTRAGTVDFDQVSGEVAHSDHSHFVNVDGARVHYQEFGSKGDTPMIFIHGYTASTGVWKTVAPLLAENGFHVVAVDMIGFGFSDKPRAFEYSIAAQARMVTRFMSRIGIGQAIIVGSSYGGAVALNIALDYPERVGKLVLVDAVCNDEPKQHPILRLAALPGLGEALTPFLIDSKAFLRKRMHGTLAKANHHLITDERIASVQRPLAAADGHHAVLATSRNWHADRLERDAHQIDHQTLIIWGEEDTVIPIKNGYKLYEEILHSNFVVLKDCGHVPQEERSELFTHIVTEFCQDKKGRVEGVTPEQGHLEQPA